MAFVSEQFDQLRDLLNDASDTQVPFATKKLYLNRGIVRMWPAIYRISSTTISLLENVYDYTLPQNVADGYILSVERETGVSEGEYVRFNQYDLIAGDEDAAGVFRLTGIHPGVDIGIRIKYAAPVPTITAASYAAAQAETWLGPDRALGLPVLYAMGMIASRRLDDRQDHTRYSTTQGQNGVNDGDIIAASQVWFGQFEAELLLMERPLPIAKD